MSNEIRKEFERHIMSHKTFILNVPKFVKLKLISRYVSYMDIDNPEMLDIVGGDLVAFQNHEFGNCIEIGEVIRIYEDEKEGTTNVDVRVILPKDEYVYGDGTIYTITPSYIWCYFEPADREEAE